MNKIYWVSSQSLNSNELDSSAEYIARSAASTSYMSREQCEIIRNSILDLSMQCLADVRGNYYWPEFYKEVSRRAAGCKMPAQDGLTRFCRDIFLRTDSGELSHLQDISVRNRFIALIFEQAGIGKDRNKIIRNFLEWVVKYRSSIAKDGFNNRADIPIGEFIKSMPIDSHHDIELLGTVLSRIASELLILVEAIESHPDRLKMTDWSWMELSTWWKGKTGKKLDELTPSASNVLLEWISQLTFVWTRADLFRLSRIGVLDCEWPDGSNCSSYRRHEQLPLGNAILRRSDIVEHIYVVESRYITSTSDDDYRAVKSRKELNYYHKFKWRHGKLYLVLGNVTLGDLQGQNYALFLAGKSIWQGDLINGICKGGKTRFIDISQLDLNSRDVVCLEMKRGIELIESREIKLWPLSDNGFLVCTGAVCRPNRKTVRHVRPGETAGVITLFMRRNHNEQVLSNIAEDTRYECEILNENYTEIRFGANSRRVVSISSGKLNWELQFVTVPLYSYLSDKEIVLNSITFTGSGNIQVVENSTDILIRISEEYKDIIYEGNAGLWLHHDEFECFSQINRDDFRHDGSDLYINITQMAVNSGIQPVSGIIEVLPGTSEEKFGQVLRFFIIPDYAEVNWTAIGDFSTVSIGLSDDIRKIDSNKQVSAKDLAGSKYANGVILGSDWQVALKWKPVILDITINGLSGRNFAYRLPFLSINDQELPAILCISPFFPDGYQAELEINSAGLPAISGTEYDYTSEILSAIVSSGTPSGLLSIKCGSEKIEWVIDASPAVKGLKVEKASRIGGVLQIALSLQVRSLLETDMEISVKYQKLTSESVSKKTQQCQQGTLPETLSYMFCLDAGSQAGFDIDANIFADGKPIYTFHETITAEIEFADDDSGIKNNIKSLIVAYRKTKSSIVLQEIFFSYLDLVAFGNGPVNSSAISRSFSAGHQPGEEKALMMALRMIDYAHSGSSELIRMPSLSGLPKSLASLLASMWLLLSGRYAINGILDPKDFNIAQGFVRSIGMEYPENDRINKISTLSCIYASWIASSNGFDNAIGSGKRGMADFSDSAIDSKMTDCLRRICNDFDLFCKEE